MNYSIDQLKSIAKTLRRDIVQMIGYEKTGHLGGSCSAADIVAVLYFHTMKHDPNNPHMPDRDRFLLSKGHSALVQYAALAETGYFPKDELSKLKKIGAKLQGHPDMLKVPGIEANTGSLGQGLSIAAGMAAGGKIDKLNYKVFCLIGDGEMSEGQIWEAAMIASFYKIDNLIAILDLNGLAATGCVAERFNTLSSASQRWESFGWYVIECNGHDIKEIIEAFNKASNVRDKPVIVIANTVKGKGISFAENNAAFHNGAMTKDQYDKALEELK